MRLMMLFIGLGALLHAAIGSVAAMQGKADIIREDATLSVKAGLALEERDIVQTFDKTRLQVMLTDQTVITIGPNTRFAFEHYLYDGTEKSQASMRMQRGFFRAITGKIGKVAPERFNIDTKSASIGIRGTHFTGFVDPDNEIIGCISGTIVVTTISAGEFVVEAGQMLMLIDGQWEQMPLQLDRFGPVVRITGRRDKGGNMNEPGVQDMLNDVTSIESYSEGLQKSIDDKVVDDQVDNIDIVNDHHSGY